MTPNYHKQTEKRARLNFSSPFIANQGGCGEQIDSCRDRLSHRVTNDLPAILTSINKVSRLYNLTLIVRLFAVVCSTDPLFLHSDPR